MFSHCRLPQLKAGFFQRHLFRQRYVCIFREGHALDRDALTLRDFEEAQHIVVVAGGTGHAIVDEIIEKRGIKRNDAKFHKEPGSQWLRGVIAELSIDQGVRQTS